MASSITTALDSPLDPGDKEEEWSSSAFMRGTWQETQYNEPKNPCGNCQVIVLKGLIPTNTEAGTCDTFQGTCAEYIPVNELIKNDAQDCSTVKKSSKLIWKDVTICLKTIGRLQRNVANVTMWILEHRKRTKSC